MEKGHNYSYQPEKESNSRIKEPGGDEISLKEVILKIQEWWGYLLSKWVIILVAGIVGGLVGLFYAFNKKPVYNAEFSFALEVDQSAGGLSGALGLASQFGFDMGGNAGGAFEGDNLLALMKSRSIVENTLLSTAEINGKSKTLVEHYIDFNKLREGWKEQKELVNIRFLPNADRSKFTLKQDSLLGKFHEALIENNLVVEKLDKKLSIITVKVTSENELFSKYFTEFLVKNVSDFYVQTKTKKATLNLQLLQHQTDSVRKELNSAISGVATSTDINPNPNPSRMVLRVPSQRRQVDVQANQAILTELIKSLELARVSLRRETPFIQAIDKPVLPLEKERLGKLKALIIGGVIGGFLTVMFLLARKIIRDVVA